jgi:hypothetical protein
MGWWDLGGWDLAYADEIQPCGWDLAYMRMRSSLVVRASDCQCTSCNGPGFDPSICRHSGIWGAADEAVLNIVRKKEKKSPQKILKKKKIRYICFWPMFLYVWAVLRILQSSSKNCKKNLDSYCFVTFFYFLSLKNDVNVPSKSNKQKNFEQNSFFVDVLTVNDENRRIRIRIQIRIH